MPDQPKLPIHVPDLFLPLPNGTTYHLAGVPVFVEWRGKNRPAQS